MRKNWKTKTFVYFGVFTSFSVFSGNIDVVDVNNTKNQGMKKLVFGFLPSINQEVLEFL